jgi:transcriptional regulator with XRE-family HTH domain
LKTLGSFIRTIRINRNLSQENIAEDIKMTQQGYSKIENDKKDDIKVSKLRAIANVFGVKPEDLLSLDDKVIFNIHNNTTANDLVINQYTSDDKEQIIAECNELKKQLAAIEKKIKQ